MKYRPRMAAALYVPEFVGAATDNVVPISIRPRSASYILNDHNHADECEVVASWGEVGVDPRLIKHGILKLWMGEAGAGGVFTPSKENLRFHGIIDSVDRNAKGGSGMAVNLRARDFTCLFIANKPFPTAGVPEYTDTVADAWAKICDHTGRRLEDGKIASSVGILRDAIDFRGGASNVTLGKAVTDRFARTGKVHVKDNVDAWAVWQQVVGSVGLLSWIEKDRVVVTTSTDHFIEAPNRTPLFVWGKNVLDWSEKANNNFKDKGVGLTAFDPISGTTIEAFYPSRDELQRKHKKLQTAKGKPTSASASEDYDWFEYTGITDPDILHEVAKRAYLERALQELEGKLVTSEMRVAAAEGGEVDLLSVLRAGVTIDIKLDTLDLDVFDIISSESKRVEYLMRRGYSLGAAQVIVNNAELVTKLGTSFLTRQARVHLEASSDGGKFEVEVDYVNKIQVAA